MKKAILTVLLVIFLIVGVRATTLAENKDNTGEIKIYLSSLNGFYATFSIVDSVTGVRYIAVAATENSEGWASDAIAICPRYNADGTLFTGK